jgi:hypothetical protein
MALLANHKSAGGLTLTAAPRTARVLWINSLGYALVSVLVTLPFVPFIVIAIKVQIENGGQLPDPTLDAPQWVLLSTSLFFYFLLFLSWSVTRHVFVTLPIWRHYAETLTIHGVAALGHVTQGAEGALTDAEGFAEALDVGAAI